MAPSPRRPPSLRRFLARLFGKDDKGALTSHRVEGYVPPNKTEVEPAGDDFPDEE